MPHLSKLLIYPIKSLDGVEVTEATILPGGALAHDREFVLFDPQGRVVNGKRTAKIHTLRSIYELAARTVTLRIQDRDRPAETFHLDADRLALEVWFSDFLGFPVTLQQNLHQGFPDDTDASGPTVVSLGTLETIANWFPDLSLEAVRQRFRTNLEIADVPPFWEDQLFGDVGQQVAFQIGSVTFLGNHPCQRCVVVTRDALTGEAYPNFQKQFVSQRRATLPTWTTPSRFNHFYRLTVNTIVPASEAGKTLCLGDKVSL
ncbi:MOSC domain-containing protein [Thermocoleostomius sinensis]|uniref:MOSC N-terminal beta barrel domain-containing protein n=1 Tax=Thermocoleostomius sinensis A174 TaxID=2016057 RepID=A0A9E8ZDU2_9CYAN|nr:MOSC N-terminal beta barrel domain-containing protein [Thermocoleostomius sinensis]WAL59558.1 MOSC N-terminal beta barrel domain-containing protein [Thermocoleostomius sinensis A174]